jgi:hypothetical protein
LGRRLELAKELSATEIDAIAKDLVAEMDVERDYRDSGGPLLF